jgi:15-cis-phytoene synthase
VSRDTNFYYSFLVLPADERRAIVAVWDFCRAVDDTADEADAASSDGSAALARWRAELAACFDGASPSTPQGQRLQPWIARLDLPRSAFESLIEGVEMDLAPRRYATFEDLYQYCIRVASAIGLICVRIFGCQDPASKQYAIDLGVALQLTNILRDVRGDLARGRVYIPQTDFAACDCTEEALVREWQQTGGAPPAEVRRLLAFQADRAREYYARADAVLPAVDRRRLLAARIMGSIYRAILDRIEAEQYDVFSRVIRISRPRRALIAARIWAGSLLSS